MRFYLDEMFPIRLAETLRARTVDSISALEHGYVSTPDDVHLHLAAREDRCIVTNNFAHFNALTVAFMEQGYPHAGVVLVPNSLMGRAIGRLAAALERFHHDHPDGLPPYTVLWLRPADDQ